MNDDKSVAYLGTEILTFRESELWIARWARFGVSATAKDEKQAVDKLLKKIGMAAVAAASSGTLVSFASYEEVDEKSRVRWRRLYEEWHD